MNLLWSFCFSVLASCYSVQKQERKFPDDFLFGAATASYQIEGGWNADDKTENIWDYITHNFPIIIKDMSNGDVAADTYHNYKRDVEMMRELGLKAYRFSLSWTRIIPNGIGSTVSKAGVTFYNNYINEMIKYNVTPIITLYHWDLPRKLQELGGFSNSLFPEWFESYARIAFKTFGDRVKLWITFNEPKEICYQDHRLGMASILNITDVGTYYCPKNLVLAHARAYHAYVNEFKESQGGLCGITNSVNWHSPATESLEDKYTAEIVRQGDWGIYTEPIFSKEGGFPKELSEIFAKNSVKQGYSKSRLPEFTAEEKKYTRGASDFFGINHYTTFLVSDVDYNIENLELYADVDHNKSAPSEWPLSASSWLRLAPNSLYNSLSHLHNKYNAPVIFVTENGWSTQPGAGLDDDDRITYYRAAWEDVLDALDEGINVKGYMAWSLMDNFEWMQGYTERFGLYEVDFDSPQRTRTPRKSAFVYKQLLRTRTVEHDYEPDTTTMCINKGHSRNT